MPHHAVWAVTMGGFAARALQVVADLAIADGIDAAAVPVELLAADVGVDAGALDRVLRLLSAHGVFARGRDGYRHTPASRLLRTDEPMSLRSHVRLIGLPMMTTALTQLEHALRTGRPALEMADPAGVWSYLDHHPQEAEIFDHAMTAKAGADIVAFLDAYDVSGLTSVVDVGGGRGHLLRAVLDAAPAARGVLFDLPDVIAKVAPHPRMTLAAGDFFTDGLPTARTYLLMEVLHDWPDAECVAILRAVRRAAAPGADLLVLEAILPDEHPDAGACALDVVMLAVTGGRERTTAELAALTEQAGFRWQGATQTAGRLRIGRARRQ
jgi:hypothetical protein